MSTIDAGGRSDFLSNVIARAQDRMPVVGPRPASLFEPVASAPGVAADVEDAHSLRAAESHEDVHEPVEHPTDTRAQSFVRPTLRRRPTSLEPDARVVEAAVARHAHVVEPPVSSVRASEAARSPDRPVERLIVPPLLVAAPTPLLAHPLASERPTEAHARERFDRPRRHLDDDRDVPRSDESLRATRPLATLLPQREIAASIARHAETDRASSERNGTATTTSPNVTISIGRLEVRAASSLPPAPRQKHLRQPMRLDEYLERKERAR